VAGLIPLVDLVPVFELGEMTAAANDRLAASADVPSAPAGWIDCSNKASNATLYIIRLSSWSAGRDANSNSRLLFFFAMTLDLNWCNKPTGST
jgi:hypothetical protein